VVKRSQTRMPISPLLFNLFLEPLFEATKRDENIQMA
jgi:hypothetical protein